MQLVHLQLQCWSSNIEGKWYVHKAHYFRQKDGLPDLNWPFVCQHILLCYFTSKQGSGEGKG